MLSLSDMLYKWRVYRICVGSYQPWMLIDTEMDAPEINDKGFINRILTLFCGSSYMQSRQVSES